MPTETINPRQLSSPDLHNLLQAAVAPRPIAFASTIDGKGQVNLSPFSFYNLFSSNPPILIFSPSRRVRDNSTKHSLDNVQEVPEVCINVVNFPMVEQMSLASTEYEKGVNEFIKAGFTQLPCSLIKPPRVGEAPVSFECKVNQVLPLGREGGAGNLVICEVILIHVQAQYLDAAGKLDTTQLDLVSRMGGNWYCRASGSALFEVPKPLLNKGIGVDALPESIRQSTVLTGNNLGRLGNLEVLPTQAEVELLREQTDVKTALSEGGEALHRLGQRYLETGKTEEALKILLLGS